ncbi:MAG: FkbM family methyltransferase [Candidatus Dependentiae bacterium]|nr:FkbM family methyltransferase [Candidatus Dependentiae bacterium]
MKKIHVIALLITAMNTTYTNYLQPFFPYYSQCGQDKFLNEHLFKNKRNGVFVDVGAHDGISYSNTYFFEKELGWTGLCVEPHPQIFPQLKNNRSATCYACCIGNADEPVDFMQVSGAPEMLSGIAELYDARHLERLKREVISNGGQIEIIKIPCRTLSALLEENNLFEVDFLSIDVEGAEKNVLLGIDFKRFTIKCIILENNFPDKFADIRNILISNGYKHYQSLDFDEIFTLSTIDVTA